MDQCNTDIFTLYNSSGNPPCTLWASSLRPAFSNKSNHFAFELFRAPENKFLLTSNTDTYRVRLESCSSNTERGEPSSASLQRFSFTTIMLSGTGFKAFFAFERKDLSSSSDKCPKHHWHHMTSKPACSSKMAPACPSIVEGFNGRVGSRL